MKNLRLSQRIALLSGALLLCFAVALASVYSRMKENLYEEKKATIQNMVVSTWGVIDHYASLSSQGKMGEEEAKEAAREAVRHLRYDGSNYFWVNDMTPVMIMHPIKPKLEGKNLSQVADSSGKRLFWEMVQVAREKGEGFVPYLWAKPGFEKPVRKISFVKLSPQWGWVVGSGIYLDDVEAELAKMRNLILVKVAFLTLLALGLVYLVTRSIVGPIRKAIRVLEAAIHGDFSESMDAGPKVNCSSKKNCGVTSCPSYGKEDHCWVTSGSHAVVKSCPRALKGEDCSSCELYGPKTEIQRLGSIVMAVSNSQRERAAVADAIAGGNLAVNVGISSDKDLLGKAFESMRTKLENIVGKILSSAEQIAAGSTQVADASQDLSQGATEQASALEEISSSMTEMGSQVKSNAENATHANRLADEANAAAQRGNAEMRNMVSAMEEINLAGQDISKIIKVIDEIAFQTNLLALNAAVEAARAGQHGRGFAVVAEEVRNLAARSAKAASETATLIEGSVGKASAGAEIAEKTSEALGEIVSRVDKVTDLVAEIASANGEQAEGISQVTQALSQIDRVTQANTASAEESAAAAEELSGQACGLRDMLAYFALERKENTPGAALPLGEQPGWGGVSEPSIQPGPNQIPLDDPEFGRY